MADAGRKQTDKELRELEKRIKNIYGNAALDVQEEIFEYFASFAKQDAELKEKLEAGEITEEYYTQWRLNQIGRGERFLDLRDKLAERMTKANETALAYVNDKTPGIYTLNRNYAAYEMESAGTGVDFTLYDESTVRRLIKEQPDLMPYYPKKKALKRGIDLEYGKKQITAHVTSGILTGGSMNRIAAALCKSITDMSAASAIRAARTAVTAAENGGRTASYKQAADRGIELTREWIATKDARTRHSHGAADGQRVGVDEPFTVGGEKLMFPGDASLGATGKNLYNCRCTIKAMVKGHERARETYTEWLGRMQEKAAKSAAQSRETVSMAASVGGNDWAQTIARPFSAEEQRQIVEYANERGVRIGDISAFDGDPVLLKTEIDSVGSACAANGIKNFPTIHVQALDDKDFAVLNRETNSITFNTKALRDKAITESNIANGKYFASKTLEDIGLHEVGHIFAVENKLNGVAIAKKAYYNITEKHISTKYLKELLGREISANAADQTVEIIAEMFVAERNNPTEFVKQFMALIRTGNML